MNLTTHRIEFTDAALLGARSQFSFITHHFERVIEPARAMDPEGCFVIEVDPPLYVVIHAFGSRSELNIVQAQDSFLDPDEIWIGGCRVLRSKQWMPTAFHFMELRSAIDPESCPFCQSKDVNANDLNACVLIRCNQCIAEGPMFQDRITAVAAWNRVSRKVRGV